VPTALKITVKKKNKMHYDNFITAKTNPIRVQYRALRVGPVRWATALEDDTVATAAFEVLDDDSDVIFGLAVEVNCDVEAAVVSGVDPVVTTVELSVT
jgi:hypothetical protein